VAYVTPRHLWLTKDGRYVGTGDLNAETLAYAAGDEVPDDVVKLIKKHQAEAKKSEPEHK